MSEVVAVLRRRSRRRYLANWNFVVGMILLGILLAAILASVAVPFDPSRQNLAAAFRKPLQDGYLLGTDQYGRDLLLVLIAGARYTLSVSVVCVLVGLAIGVPLGAISGYFGGRIDMAIQRFIDLVLAFPNVILALSLIALMGIGIFNLVVAVAVSSIPAFVRIMRAEALRIRELPYVDAARVMGVSWWMILVRHVIPNGLSPIIVQASISVGSAILIAAGLGFFGLGVAPPTPEWGAVLGEGRSYLFSSPHLVIVPGFCIFLAVLAFNFLGDGLQALLNPRVAS